jgi:hypothetical protein
MLANLIQSAPVYDTCWWLAALWLFRTLCLWSFFWAACPCCGVVCANCSGSTPSQIELTITGFTDGSGGAVGGFECTTCDETYNGVFVIDNGLGCVGGVLVAATCAWTYVIPSGACNFPGGGGTNIDHLTVQVNNNFGTSRTDVYFFRLGDTACTEFRRWRRDQFTSPSESGLVDCAAWVAYEVADQGGAADVMMEGSVCDHDRSSAFITAL